MSISVIGFCCLTLVILTILTETTSEDCHFIKVDDYAIEGANYDIISIAHETDCLLICLRMAVCKSVDYSYMGDRMCYIHEISRQDISPYAAGAKFQGIDPPGQVAYFEKVCVGSPSVRSILLRVEPQLTSSDDVTNQLMLTTQVTHKYLCLMSCLDYSCFTLSLTERTDGLIECKLFGKTRDLVNLQVGQAAQSFLWRSLDVIPGPPY